MWVPSHRSIIGNKKVDTLANKAIGFPTSPPINTLRFQNINWNINIHTSKMWQAFWEEIPITNKFKESRRRRIESKHITSTKCNLCKSGFLIKSRKLADHDYLSRRFTQTLYNTCNIKLQTPNFMPYFIHKLSNYDTHFIVSEIEYDSNTVFIILTVKRN